MTETIAIASDHAGFALKARLIAHLETAGYRLLDLGAYSEERVDYPDFGRKLAQAIIAGEAARGIGICGSGIGMDIALNRFAQIRSALCHSVETAQLARQHNDANVITLGARVIAPDVAIAAVDAFLATAFEGGRHAARVEKLGSCGA